MIHLLSRNDLNLVRKTQILQGAQPIEIVKMARTGSKSITISIVKNIKRKAKKGLTFV